MTTKFEELCAAYKATRRSFFDYQDAAVNFLAAVAEQLATEWGLPTVRFVPIDGKKKIDPQTTYTPFGATYYDFETGVFNMGIALTIYMEPNMYPQDNVVVRLTAQRANGDWLLGWAKRPLENVGDGKDAGRIQRVLDGLFAKLLDEYPQDAESAYKKDQSPVEQRPIGFVYGGDGS